MRGAEAAIQAPCVHGGRTAQCWWRGYSCFSVFSREWEGQEKDGNTEFVVQTFQKRRRFRTPGIASPLEDLRSGPGGEAYTTDPIAGER